MPLTSSARVSLRQLEPSLAAVAMASPEPGRPMTSKVERVSDRVRGLANDVASILVIDTDNFRRAAAPRIDGLGFQLKASATAARAVWWLIAQWLTGYATGALAGDCSLVESEDWFYGSASPHLPRLAPDVSMNEVARVASPEEVWALLPYLLDPLAPGTRRHLLASDTQAADRTARKELGVFYTPADLAGWMTQGAVASPRAQSCLDPACGSGVFLRAALGREPAALVFGTDLEPAAAEMAAFVVLASTGHDWIDSPWCGWQNARLRLATLEALALRPGTQFNDVEQRLRCNRLKAAEACLRRSEVPPAALPGPALTPLGSLFPELSEGADAVLSNPPYARLGYDLERRAWAAEFDAFTNGEPTVGTDISTLFIEFAWRLTKPHTGAAALVLPLSIAFSSGSQYRSVRRAMAPQSGRWECSFFDRAPDALFGDDVKTRNAVLRYDAAQTGVAVTTLLRWTSRNRHTLFHTIQPADVTVGIVHGIPRVGTRAEAVLVQRLRERLGVLAHDVVRSVSLPASQEMATAWSQTVFVGATAYNWFSCMRDLRPCLAAGHNSTAGFHALRFADARIADAGYALLASRIAFWLWRVEGDAFHVTRSFLMRLPVQLGQLPADAVTRLADFGRRLWTRSQTQPVVAVNKQRRTVAYPATQDEQLLFAIERTLATALDLVDEIAEADLATWYRKLVVVDDSEQRRNRMPSFRGLVC